MKRHTHGASAVAVHGEVGAEEQVGDGQEQRLGQRASSVIFVQLIGLEIGEFSVSVRCETTQETLTEHVKHRVGQRLKR